MPYVGFDRFQSAARVANQKSVELMQAVRSGSYGRIPPEMNASIKAAQFSAAKKQNVLSGNYFPNTVLKKQFEYNQATVQGFHERNNLFKQQQ